jgi:exonuclease SbcC
MRAEIERLHAGTDTLEAWRDAPETVSAWRRPWVANTVLIVACVAAVGAAVALHPIYLVLLVPLLMAIGYLTFTAQDADWVRLGAVRRFQSTRLKPPTSWERNAVDDRIVELTDAAAGMEQRLAELEASKAETSDQKDDPATELSLSMDLADASDAYAVALSNAGIEANSIDESLSMWLDQVYETRRIDSELNQLRAKRAMLSREAEEARDKLFRFLALADEAPPEGRADSEALRAGLERMAKRTSSH